jgi:hypothetical protein
MEHHMITAEGVRAFVVAGDSGKFDMGMISHDDDGITRVYIGTSGSASPEVTMQGAVASATHEAYRQWVGATVYRLVPNE